ncbi:hypothetical protein [Cloacibacterium sp.]|uniref:hypothetical protein n=1 Tax=Cloacibacterium sp. TaxID=1913682 RepID=UPI0039E2746A
MKNKKNIWLTMFCFISLSFNAQQLYQIKTEQKPLVLKAQGSFYVGGNKEIQTRTEVGVFFLTETLQ